MLVRAGHDDHASGGDGRASRARVDNAWRVAKGPGLAAAHHRPPAQVAKAFRTAGTRVLGLVLGWYRQARCPPVYQGDTWLI